MIRVDVDNEDSRRRAYVVKRPSCPGRTKNAVTSVSGAGSPSGGVDTAMRPSAPEQPTAMLAE